MSNLDRYLNYLDLFSGIGGFHLGLREAGFKFEWVGYSEIDKYAKQIYQKHFPDSEDLGDVKTIRTDKLPKLDLITFGFPCQDISIAGKRAGIQAPRSNLFFEAMRIVRDAKPTYFIFENVKGLFSSSNGECWKSVLKEIANSGYDGQWQLLNTRWFLPQNRERIYFVGHIRGEPRPQIFPIGENNQNNDDMVRKTESTRQRIQTKDICPSLATGEKWKAFIIPTLCQIGTINKDSEATRVYSVEGIARTIKNGGGMGAKTGLYVIDTKKQGEPRFSIDCPTLQETNYKEPIKVTDGIKIRRLTPLECERLQGFPDDWTEKGLTNVKFYGNISFKNTRYICDKYVELKNVIELLYQEKKKSASCTIKDYGKEELQINISFREKNVNIVEMMQLQDYSVTDIINLGNDMVTLCNQKEILNNAEQIKKNLIQEKMEKKSTLPLWKISLKENYNQKRLSIISTWTNEIIKNPIFTYVQTEKPITNVIVLWNQLEQNYTNEESLDLKMANISLISNTQRYKCLGNAISVPVVVAILKRLKPYLAQRKIFKAPPTSIG